jgi:hypothetical protein
MYRQVSVKLPNIRFRENPFSGSLVVSHGRTDSRAKLMKACLQLLVANASKKEDEIITNEEREREKRRKNS